MLQTFEITVKGKVQGVYYRQSTLEKANQLGLSGEVRNLGSGDVYIVATGSAGQLQQLIDWCKTGPARAVVTDVRFNEIEVRSFNSFIIRR